MNVRTSFRIVLVAEEILHGAVQSYGQFRHGLRFCLADIVLLLFVCAYAADRYAGATGEFFLGEVHLLADPR